MGRNTSRRGNLFVISGFSGSGKGTVMEWFRNHEGYALSISCTSRKPREKEKDGREYYFISHEEFMERVKQEYFLEHAIYADHAYGTPAKFVEDNLAAGKDVLLEIDIQGAAQVRKKYPHTTLIFITPPSIEELKRRLEIRGTESQDQIEKRLRRAVEEGEHMDGYDYIIVNDKVDLCIQELHNLMQSTHRAIYCNGEFVSEMKEELKEMQKNLKIF